MKKVTLKFSGLFLTLILLTFAAMAQTEPEPVDLNALAQSIEGLVALVKASAEGGFSASEIVLLALTGFGIVQLIVKYIENKFMKK